MLPEHEARSSLQISQETQFSTQDSAHTVDEIAGIVSKRARIDRSPSPIISKDDKNVAPFFVSIIDQVKNKLLTEGKELCRPSFILVCHMAPTIFTFLEAIKNIGEIALIIPKGHKRPSAQKIIHTLKEKKIIDACNILEPTTDARDEIKQAISSIGIEVIKKYVNNKPFIIIDIGGYFANSLKRLIFAKEEKQLRDNFLGIIEDTENGHQKYQHAINRILTQKDQLSEEQCTALNKIYSVARCALKNTEDYSAGKSIVEACDTILRNDLNTYLDRMKTAGIIGFGKIGKSIAHHLRQKNLKGIIIYDSDPIKNMEASSQGFTVSNRQELISSSDIIFSATGNMALKGEDVLFLKNDVYIASCTSSEDEFHASFWSQLSGKHASHIESGNIHKYKIRVGNKKSINLLDDGDAVNFVYGAVNGPYIYSVQAGLIASAICLMTNSDTEIKTNLKELPKELMDIIAISWLESFDQCKNVIDIYSSNFLLNGWADITETKLMNICKELEQYAHHLNSDDAIKIKLNSLIVDVKSILTILDRPVSSLDSIAAKIKPMLEAGFFVKPMMRIIDWLIRQSCINKQKGETNDTEFLNSILKSLLLQGTGIILQMLHEKDSIAGNLKTSVEAQFATVYKAMQTYINFQETIMDDQVDGCLKLLLIKFKSLKQDSVLNIQFSNNIDDQIIELAINLRNAYKANKAARASRNSLSPS